MQTVIVKYALKAGMERSLLLSAFEGSTGKFAPVPGLIRKYFCFDQDKMQGVSVYLFASQKDADGFFSEPFMTEMTNRFGSRPELYSVDTLLVLDNEQKKVVSNPA